MEREKGKGGGGCKQESWREGEKEIMRENLL